MTAWETITGRALNPGVGPTALVANTSDSFQIRSTPDTSPPFLEGIWVGNATGGLVRVRSPRMHDAVQGLRFTVPAGVTRNLLAYELDTQMYSQDIVTFEIGGGAAETDSGALLLRYPDLGGSVQRLGTWQQIKPLVAELVTVEVAVAGPVTAGDWSAGTAINATFDLLKGNQDYAVLGYTTDTLCTAIAIKGSDTANLRYGGPGPIEPLETRQWYVWLTEFTGTPAIPVINQANRASTFVHVCKNTAAGTVNVDLVLARLTAKFQ
jgi:hypothetical protein